MPGTNPAPSIHEGEMALDAALQALRKAAAHAGAADQDALLEAARVVSGGAERLAEETREGPLDLLKDAGAAVRAHPATTAAIVAATAAVIAALAARPHHAPPPTDAAL